MEDLACVFPGYHPPVTLFSVFFPLRYRLVVLFFLSDISFCLLLFFLFHETLQTCSFTSSAFWWTRQQPDHLSNQPPLQQPCTMMPRDTPSGESQQRWRSQSRGRSSTASLAMGARHRLPTSLPRRPHQGPALQRPDSAEIIVIDDDDDDNHGGNDAQPSGSPKIKIELEDDIAWWRMPDTSANSPIYISDDDDYDGGAASASTARQPEPAVKQEESERHAITAPALPHMQGESVPGPSMHCQLPAADDDELGLFVDQIDMSG